MKTPARGWDVFCRVVDHWGDAGVCWRLCRQLAGRGHAVRLWIDDPEPLEWMAPDGAPGVEIVAWREPLPPHAPGEVVIEAFGCDPPAAFVERMAAAHRPPVWIDLEYLSAETWVERCHRLPSPQLSGPGAGATKWFFFPGFTPATGGLLRDDRAIDDPPAAAGDAPPSALLFCYSSAPGASMQRALRDAGLRILLAPGSPEPVDGAADIERLALQTQPAFDSMLRSNRLNAVRGEDSFVQAQWAGRPFVWNAYPQADGAHAAKLEAFLHRFLEGAPHGLAAELSALHRRWNGLEPGEILLPPLAAWSRHCAAWRDALRTQPDLTTQLCGFVEEKR